MYKYNLQNYFKKYRQCLLMLFILPCATHAASEIKVTKFSDSNDGQCDDDCSLREAVDYANNTPGAHIIKLEDGTYHLDIPVENIDEDNEFDDEDQNVNGDLDIKGDLSIMGPATIDGHDNDRILEVISGHTTLWRVSLINGYNPNYGGAIENHASLHVDYALLKNNRAEGAWRRGVGGAIANFGSLTVYHSEFEENKSRSGEGRFLGKGGAIFNAAGANLIVRDSRFYRNSADGGDFIGSGGAVFNAGTADIRRSLFHQNRVFSDSYGGALHNTDGGHLKIMNSTISDNMSGNSIEYPGGAVANGGYYYEPGELYLTHVTIVDNINGGLYVGGPTYIKNSIIAGNFDERGLSFFNCYREDSVSQLNTVATIFGTYGNRRCWGEYRIDNRNVFKHLVQPLAENDGRFLSHQPFPDSMAIDLGQSPCPSYDQRLKNGLVDGDQDGEIRCDIGAIEWQGNN